MRLLILFCTLLSLTATAQIVEQPLTSNPLLERLAQEKKQERQASIAAFQRQYATRTSFRGTETQDTEYVVSGDTLVLCYENIPDEANVSCVDCTDAAFGEVILNDQDCLEYASNPNLIIESESIALAVCVDNACDTILFPIVIKRAGQCIDQATVSLEATEMTDFCADTISLEGNWVSTEILTDALCSEYEDNGTLAYLIGDICGIYESSTLFADTDKLCVVVCDEYTICDTIKIPFAVRQDTLQLPFFDDFSYAGPYPDTERWLNTNVYINNNLAYNPPSVGVATFDGVDAGGSPYYMGNNLPSDILTSTYIDLSATNQAFLSFYIQPKGNSDAPEQKDSLILQFKNELDQWVQIDAFSGVDVSIDSIPPFTRHFYTNEFTSQFLYDGFQFRFINKSSGTGIVDIWNLDYVLLNDENQGSIFEDVAFTQRPNDILSPYSSMPWEQFEGNAANELDKFISVGIINHANETANAGDSNVFLNEVTTGTSVFDADLFNGQEANIAAGVFRTNTYNLDSNDPIIFPNVWTGLDYLNTMETAFDGSEYLAFELTYELESTLNSNLSNDVVSRTTIFDNYFAYDDGTAESNIVAQGPGTQVAVKFHANKATELTALQVYIPRLTNNVSTQLFRLHVWENLEEAPIYTTEDLSPIYIDAVADSIGGFTTYRFQDAVTNELTPLAIPAGDFYVGWEQVSNNFTDGIPVGFDKNNHVDDIMFGRVDGTWYPSFYNGVLMIRPLVGEVIPFSTDTQELSAAEAPFQIYPNPSAGQFMVQLAQADYENYHFEIYNNMGQRIQHGHLSDQLDLTAYGSGIYFLKILNLETNKLFHERLISKGY